MFINIMKILLMATVMTIMLGCREYNLYKYKPMTLELLGGELHVALEGFHGKAYEEDGKKMADLGAPYSLVFGLSLPYEFELTELIVEDIELVGEKNGKHFSLPKVGSKKISDPREFSFPDATARTVIVSVSDIIPEEFVYQNYILTATVVVVESNESLKRESISIRLETSFKRERRSDWFDRNMGV